MSGPIDLPKQIALRLAIRQVIAIHALRAVVSIFDEEIAEPDSHVEYLLAKATALELELLNDSDIVPADHSRINTILPGPLAKLTAAADALMLS